MKPVWFGIERLSPEVPIPVRATLNSAGYDVSAFFGDRPVEVIRNRAPANCPIVSDDNSELHSPEEVILSHHLASTSGLLINPGDRVKMPLGFKLMLAPGYHAQLMPRSGHAWRHGLALANGVGLIDADYPAEWHALLVNNGQWSVRIKHLERVAQVVFVRHEIATFLEGQIVQTTDRTGGFSSTGIA